MIITKSLIYNNCHSKLIDPGLKGGYTKVYKMARR